MGSLVNASKEPASRARKHTKGNGRERSECASEWARRELSNECAPATQQQQRRNINTRTAEQKETDTKKKTHTHTTL